MPDRLVLRSPQLPITNHQREGAAEASRRRLLALVAGATAFGLILIAQLIRLQVVEHDYWIDEREKWQSETRDIVPERGRIWDRNGLLLAGNEP
ncbi:MAG TPA: hypothetical protein VFL17_10275, partial [Anaerolineae bacterium]|nr:hypothetical protein [Anaerolineae bacterium]